jgi:phage baseplate assembly protein W
MLDYPYRIDARGRTAVTGAADHVRDLIEQVLFTRQGERVNRPSFGSGLLHLVFAPNGDTLAAATQFLVQGALQEHLADLIHVEGVDVSAEDATVRVTVRYVLRRTGERRTDTFTR